MLVRLLIARPVIPVQRVILLAQIQVQIPRGVQAVLLV
jgi:hypothetical protein